MVIDTSALAAILQDEPERRRFNEAIESAAQLRGATPHLDGDAGGDRHRHRGALRGGWGARPGPVPGRGVDRADRGRRQAGTDRPRGLSPLRQGPPPRGAQLRRRAAPVQGTGLLADRYRCSGAAALKVLWGPQERGRPSPPAGRHRRAVNPAGKGVRRELLEIDT